MMRSPTRGSATRALPKPCLRRSTLGVPPRGVRSVGEVFTHITAANCGIAGARGTTPPAGIDLKAITGVFADKPEVLQAMKDSFGHVRNAIVALNDADADKPQRCSTVRPPCADLSS